MPQKTKIIGVVGLGENAGAAWVHSRDKVNGDTLVSTQNPGDGDDTPSGGSTIPGEGD